MWNVFLTGATGFLGGEIAVALSKLDSVEKIACLVRSKEDCEAVDRLERVFALHEDLYDPRKVIAVRGSLTDEKLSCDLARHPDLSDINLVIHSGANTSFLSQKYAAVAETNINGTQRVARWASGLKSLEAFAFIGTATIAGAGQDVVGRTIYEDESPNDTAKHLVGYTQSKMLAEMAVRNILPEEKLAVIRPSILVGDSRCLVPRSFDIAWIIVALRHLRMFFGDPDASCDIIPVDYAADAIVKLLTGPRRYTTYHVSAGAASTTCRNIIDAVVNDDSGVPEFVYTGGEQLHHLKKWLRTGKTPHPSLARYSRQLEYIHYGIGRKKARMLLSGLDAYWKFIDLDQRFDNTRLLEDTGIGLPEPAHNYLGRTAMYFGDLDPLEAAVNP
jgi:thioester reductase-like protein